MPRPAPLSEAQSALLGSLEAEDWRERERATTAIAAQGEAAAPMVGPLAQRIAHADWRVRRSALRALRAWVAPLAPHARGRYALWPHAGAVEGALADRWRGVREAALELMAELGEAGVQRIEAVVRCLEDKDGGVRKTAADALARLAKARDGGGGARGRGGGRVSIMSSRLTGHELGVAEHGAREFHRPALLEEDEEDGGAPVYDLPPEAPKPIDDPSNRPSFTYRARTSRLLGPVK